MTLGTIPSTALGAQQYVGRTFSGTTTGLLDINSVRGSRIIDGAAQITTVARIWLDAGGTGAHQTAINFELGSGASGLSLGVSSTGVARAAGRSTTTDSFQSKLGTTVIPSGEWHTIAAVNDIAGDTINVYLDGVLNTSGSAVATFTAPVYTSGTSFDNTDRIGNDAATPPTTPFKGKLADIAVFTRALSGAELLAIAQGQRPSQASGGEPAVYFPLDSATDGAGRFANSRFGGALAIPLGNVTINTGTQPTVNAHSAIPAEGRFSPTRVLRLNADDAAAVGDGGVVASIPMRNAGVSATQILSPNKPTLAVLGGGNAIRFTASTSQYMTVPGLFDFDRGITVVTLMDARNTGRVISASQSSVSDIATSSFSFTPNAGMAVAGPATLHASTYTDYTAGVTGTALFSGRYSGTAVVNWLNGTKRNGTVTGGTELSDGSFRPTTLPTGSTAFPLQIGRRLNNASSNLYFDGDIHDMIIVNGSLTDEEVRFLEGVMAWENGMTSLLPSNHPWKNIQPTVSSTITYPWGNAVVARSDAPSSTYIGSPSLIRTSDGKLYAAHDTFGGSNSTGRVYVSEDNGASWYGLAQWPNYYWGSLWQHTDGYLYNLAVTRANGDLQIGRSTDGGATWTWVALSGSGKPLAAAGTGTNAPNYHRGGGLPPHYFDGHLFAEVANDPNNTLDVFAGKQSFIVYASSTSDLMNPSSWATTTRLVIGSTGFSNNTNNTQGYIEGNVTSDDTGALWLVARLAGSATPNKAVFIPLGWDGTTVTMPAWSSSFVKTVPGANVKFQLIKNGGNFYSLVNDNTAVDAGIGSGMDFDQRDRVSFIKGSTADLSNPSFAIQQNVVNQTTLSNGFSASDSIKYTGFQYPSLQMANDSVYGLYRVAWSDSDDYHNANMLGFGSFPYVTSAPSSGGFSTVTTYEGSKVTVSSGQKTYSYDTGGYRAPTSTASSSVATTTVSSSATSTSAATTTAPVSTSAAAATTSGQIHTGYSFGRNLQFGMTNPDVKILQQVLNSLGFTVAKTGAGAPGKETAYFGAATRTALGRLQKHYGIVPAAGYFGPVTRDLFNGWK